MICLSVSGKIPHEISRFEKLKYLCLENNQINTLPKEILELDLDLKEKYDFKAGIFLKGNPLESPPWEIIHQGRKAVEAYFKSLEKEEKQA